LGVVEGNDDNEMLTFLKKPANAKAAQTVLVQGFKTQMEGKTGLNSTLLKCKMISNKAGFLQPASDMMWILPMTSEESLPTLSSRETNTYKKALEEDSKKAKPDAAGKAPADKPTGEKLPESKVSANDLSSI